MKKNILIAVAAVVIFGGLAAYFYWQHSQPKPEPVHVQAPPPPPKPEVRQVVEAPPAAPPLPALADSDNFMLDALAGLIGNKSLMKFFHTERIIHNIVATIDNLPRRRAPMSVMPVERVLSRYAMRKQKYFRGYAYLASSPADDFLHANAMYRQRIGDQRAMATPRYGLGTHQRDSLSRCQFYEFGQIFRKFRSLHVVGETAEGNISPSHIHGPWMRAAKDRYRIRARRVALPRFVQAHFRIGIYYLFSKQLSEIHVTV